MVYLIHLDRPLHHAKHYLGYCDDGGIHRRMKEHRTGYGAAMTRACVERGIGLHLVAVFPGGRGLERAIKNGHNHCRVCPVCALVERGYTQQDALELCKRQGTAGE